MLGDESTEARVSCLVYNYCGNQQTPTSCDQDPPPSTGNNGNVMGYFYRDLANPSPQHKVIYTYDPLNRLFTVAGSPIPLGTISSFSHTYSYVSVR